MIEYIDFDKLTKRLNSLKTDTILIVIDQNIWSQYREKLPLDKGALGDKRIILWKGPDGEKVKNFSDYQSCVEFFLEKGVHRNSHLVAIGGGATSDMAGFVAATLLRGISWSVVPTSLLAMVDASIGGKTGINSKYGKNLVGAFHHPSNVFINLDFLYSLPEEEMISGKGEVLKYMLLSKEVYDVGIDHEGIHQDLIKECVQFKEKIVKQDFKENGKRKILNLGHTLGHGIEKYYNITHGKAVAFGMILIFLILDEQENLKILKKANNSLKVLSENTPWHNKVFPIVEIIDFVSKDKKANSNSAVDIITIEGVGNPITRNITFAKLKDLLEEKKDLIRTYVL